MNGLPPSGKASPPNGRSATWRRLPLHVLCPRGKDPYQDFAGGVPGLDELKTRRIHAPLNHHAWAACTGGAYHPCENTLPADSDVPALVLLRRDMKASLRCLRKLRVRGHRTVICWKEAGLFQVQKQLEQAGAREAYQEMCLLADGAIACTPDLSPLYTCAGAQNVLECPTPLPLGLPGWSVALPTDQREGIFLGTREFDVAARCHSLALEIALDAALREGTYVTAIAVKDPPRAWRAALRAASRERIYREHKGPLPYPDYLRLLAMHRVVFQLDRGAVPGQVAGDALLAEVLLVGGDGATERLAYPDTCGYGRCLAEVQGLLLRALEDRDWCQQGEAAARERAWERLSFASVSRILSCWLASLALAGPDRGQ